MLFLDQPRRHLAVAATCGALALGAASAYAGDLELTTRRDGDGIEINARARLSGSAESAWKVLTDYERYAAFIPDLHTSKIVSRIANRLVVEQRGEARFLWFKLPMIATLAVTETAPVRVESQLMRGTLREMRGRYELVNDADGLRFVYTGRLVPDAEQRGLFDHVAIRANVTRQLEALVREIDRAGANND